MSSTYVPAALRRLVEERANRRCEYCLLPGNISFFPHEIDHVIAEKHGGKTDADNLVSPLSPISYLYSHKSTSHPNEVQIYLRPSACICGFNYVLADSTKLLNQQLL